MGSTSDSSRKNSYAKFTPHKLRAQSANTAKAILELGLEHANDVFRVKAVRYYDLGVPASVAAVFMAVTRQLPLRYPHHWYFILINETTGDEFVLEYYDCGIYFTLLDDDAIVDRDVNPRGRLFGFVDGYDKACFDQTHTGAEIAEYLNNNWSQKTNVPVLVSSDAMPPGTEEVIGSDGRIDQQVMASLLAAARRQARAPAPDVAPSVTVTESDIGDDEEDMCPVCRETMVSPVEGTP